MTHHVLLGVPGDLCAVGPHPERLPDEGLEVRHLVDVRLRHVRVVPLHHLRDLFEDLGLHVGVGGEGVEVEEDRRRRRAQPVGEQRQADYRYIFEAGIEAFSLGYMTPLYQACQRSPVMVEYSNMRSCPTTIEF